MEFVRDIVTSSIMIMWSIHTIQARLSVRGKEGGVSGGGRGRGCMAPNLTRQQKP